MVLRESYEYKIYSIGAEYQEKQERGWSGSQKTYLPGILIWILSITKKGFQKNKGKVQIVPLDQLTRAQEEWESSQCVAHGGAYLL